MRSRLPFTPSPSRPAGNRFAPAPPTIPGVQRAALATATTASWSNLLTSAVSSLVNSASIATGLSCSFWSIRNFCISSHCRAVMSPQGTDLSL
ncbi:hypothetical protein E8M01_23110 [Phreatobacter stygius]|uniref:Uncharacterized protein n=1 Tax=Phreatobacter stygius TaxID=1940610 RepID=A0A4D7AZV2_9HYPH|nr:hypothetical protein E8M01_23110 [Phreatobacter stygius]